MNVDGCPCLYTKPCTDACTCVNEFSSAGCGRCCKYGSEEQRRAMAFYLARAIDQAEKSPEFASLKDHFIEVY